MKILERLRSLASTFPIEPQSIEPGYEVTPLDMEPIDYEETYGFADEGTAAEFDIGLHSHTIDGFRRRIPDVHEEIPPESHEFSDATENLDSR